MKCGPLCSSIFPIGPIQYSFSWNPDTKFCLHAAGGIYVNENFEQLEGKIGISGSSAKYNGGAVLRSPSWVFLFEMAVGSGRSTPWSEDRKELKRFLVSRCSFPLFEYE